MTLFQGPQPRPRFLERPLLQGWGPFHLLLVRLFFGGSRVYSHVLSNPSFKFYLRIYLSSVFRLRGLGLGVSFADH